MKKTEYKIIVWKKENQSGETLKSGLAGLDEAMKLAWAVAGVYEKIHIREEEKFISDDGKFIAGISSVVFEIVKRK